MIKKHLSLILAILMIMQVFSLTVSADAVGLLADMDAVTEASLLKVAKGEDDLLIDNLNLPIAGANGSTISWSEPEGIIAANGTVTRPAEDTEVTLTATFVNGEDTDTKDFVFTVAGASTRAYDMPIMTESVYYDDFEDGEMDSRIVPGCSGDATVTEENGALRFARPSSGTTGATVYVNEDQTGISGKVVAEFIMKRPANNQKMLSAQIVGESGLIGIVTWWDAGTGIINVNYADTIAGGDGDHLYRFSEFGATETLKVTMYLDSDARTVTFWLNNQFAGSGYTRAGTDIQRIYFYNSSQANVDVTVDDLRFYHADFAASDAMCVESDHMSLSQSSFYKAPMVGDYVVDTLALPTEGANDTTITWASSHEDIISPDGWVTRPASDTVVTMTATVSKGEVSKDKEFNFIVPGKNTEAGDLPLVIDMQGYDDFNDETPSSQVTLTPGEGVAEETGGVIQLAKTGAAGMTAADIYLKEDQTIAEGQFVTEFILTRKTSAVSSVAFYGDSVGVANGSLAFLLNWWDNGNNIVNLQFANELNGTRQDHIFRLTDYDARERLKVTVFFDTVNQRLSVWLNNKFAANGYTTGAKGVRSASFYNENSAFDCAIDDFRFYTAGLPGDASERVAEDLAKITETSLLKAPMIDGMIIDSLSLLTTGENGCSIEWSSTNENVIDTEGNVFRAKENETVTLTATVSYMGEGTQSKDFTFTVAGLGAQPAGMPKLTSLVSLENFNDNIVDYDRIVLTDGSGMAREQGGTLNIIKPTSAGTTAANVYLDKTQASVTEGTVLEFVMTRKSNAVFSAQIYGSAGLFMILNWWPTNDGIDLQFSDSKDVSYSNHFFKTVDFGAEKSLKATFYLKGDGHFAMWLNNKPVIEDGYCYQGKSVSRVYYYNGGSACNATVDDFRVYYAQEEDAVAVDKDIEKLDAFFTPGGLTDGVLYQSVELPTEGAHGSTISWVSSNEAMFAPDGTLNRPTEDAYPEDPTVTMTATVTSGDVTKTKTFTFTVLRTGVGDRKIAETDASKLTLEVLQTGVELVGGYITHDLSLPRDGQFGSTIEWESSIPELITDEGEIVFFPETGEDSPTVILTAYVTFGEVTYTKEIEVHVMPREADETLRQALPEPEVPGEYFHKDDFDDDSNQTVYRWSLRPYGNGVAGVVNGKMQISRHENQGSNYITHVEFNAHESRLAQEGLTAFDFTWDRNRSGACYIIIRTGDGDLVRLDWNKDLTITASYADSLGGGVVSATTAKKESEVRVTGRVDGDTDTFTLWIDEEIFIKDGYPMTGVNAGLRYFFFGIADNNLMDMYIDNVRCYNVKPYLYEQPFMDSKKLTEEVILTGPFAMPQTISTDLNLITEGYYGSDISWESSHPDIIDPETGAVTRPVDTDEKPYVTLTATVTEGGYVAKKQFSFYVLPTFSSDSNFVQADINFLTFENYGIFAFDDNSLDAVRYSLQLPSELSYGSKIMWATSDSSVLTSSGRVIRPRWDMPARNVVLTATVSHGDAVQTKEFNITVLPDEELKDPGYMPDEEFFGVWNGSSWTQEGKFNYAANPEMAEVEAAAKAGDYEAAKVALLAYLRGRPNSLINTGSTSRNTDYVDQIAMNSIWHYQSDRWLMGYNTIINHEYQQIAIPIRSTSTIGAKLAYNIESKYNEASSISIASKEHPNPAFRPQLRVMVGGQPMVYTAVADATLRSGQYDFVNYGTEESLKVKMFGELQGDETWISSILFDTNGIPGGVESAELLLTVKLDQDYVESKDIIVYEEPNVGWTDTDVTYGRTTKFYHNVNGIPGDMDWLRRGQLKYSDSEYQQTHRFQNFGEILTEYEYTKDEKYAYKLLYTMMDYIIDSQFKMTVSEYWSYNGGYLWSDYNELDIAVNGGHTKRRGGMPQLLTTSIRLTTWIPMYERLLKSQYMTPDVCTTILKNFWDCSHEGERYLLDYALGLLGDTPTANNQWVIEANNISKVALCFPEFSEGDQWLDSMLRILEWVKLGGYASDGAYGEAAQGYSETVLNQYYDYIIMMHKAGKRLPDDFEEFLYNTTIYNMMINTDSSGVAMSWGDAGWSKSWGRRMPRYEEINPEENYMFISTRGAEGVAPNWTSIHFPSNRVTIMQSDWSKNALHGFIDANGIGGHGHPDDNALRVTAYGEYLLIDPGVFSYDNTIYRKYGISTLAHNTVEVDNQTQRYSEGGDYGFVLEGNEEYPAQPLSGTVHEWSTNNQFDVLSQTAGGYSRDYFPNDTNDLPEVNHRRTITFLKSGFWIVSDLMESDNDREHEYKQLWHFMPKAGLKVNARTGQMTTSQNGVNMIVSSPVGEGSFVATESPEHDPDNPKQQDGWFSRRWGTGDYAPYGYYYKKTAGNTGVDTLLFPYQGKGGAATTESIDLGVPVDVATAMKMSTTMNGKTSETSYMLEYEPTMGTTRTFGDYKGDGMVNVVRTDKDGKIEELILNKGTTLQKADGTVLLDTNGKLANIGLEVRGNTAVITTNDSQASGEVNVNPEDISFAAQAEIENVLIDGTYYAFTQEDGVVNVENETKDEVLNNDVSGDRGGITSTTPSGGSQGGGNQSGGSSIGGGQGGIVTPQAPAFNDIEGHWAAEAIARMAEKKIVNGDNGAFRPDANISRAELITMVVRALDLPTDAKDTGFSDVAEDSWYAPYVKAALDKGIIAKDTVFRPNDQVTREEMAKILSGADTLLTNSEMTVPEDYALSYKDSADIAEWATPFVKYASHLGLMNGMEDNSFAPKASGTRAQVVTVLDRIFKELQS